MVLKRQLDKLLAVLIDKVKSKLDKVKSKLDRIVGPLKRSSKNVNLYKRIVVDYSFHSKFDRFRKSPISGIYFSSGNSFYRFAYLKSWWGMYGCNRISRALQASNFRLRPIALAPYNPYWLQESSIKGKIHLNKML